MPGAAAPVPEAEAPAVQVLAHGGEGHERRDQDRLGRAEDQIAVLASVQLVNLAEECRVRMPVGGAVPAALGLAADQHEDDDHGHEERLWVNPEG